MWLDELQRYLDGEHGLTGAVVRALLIASHPVVIIGTLWPDRYAAYTTVPAPGAADPHAREREVLDLAGGHPRRPGVQRGGAGPGPRRRGPRPAAEDRAGGGRVRADPDTGGRAAARRPLGGRSDRQPVRVGGAYRGAGYGPARRPRPAECRLPARRRARLLHQPAAGRGAGQLVRAGPGLRHQQAARCHRRAEPHRLWHGPRDRVHRRGLPDPARQPGTPTPPAYPQAPGTPSSPTSATPPTLPGSRTAPETGCCTATPSRCTVTPPTPATGMPPPGLAGLLAERGDLDEAAVLRAGPTLATRFAAIRLAGRLGQRVPTLAELRARADTGDWTAAVHAGRAAGRARSTWTELRARADTGDRFAAWSWPDCWPRGVDLDGAARPGRRRRRGLPPELAGLLAERGDLDGAARPGRRRRR